MNRFRSGAHRFRRLLKFSWNISIPWPSFRDYPCNIPTNEDEFYGKFLKNYIITCTTILNVRIIRQISFYFSAGSSIDPFSLYLLFELYRAIYHAISNTSHNSSKNPTILSNHLFNYHECYSKRSTLLLEKFSKILFVPFIPLRY